MVAFAMTLEAFYKTPNFDYLDKIGAAVDGFKRSGSLSDGINNVGEVFGVEINCAYGE